MASSFFNSNNCSGSVLSKIFFMVGRGGTAGARQAATNNLQGGGSSRDRQELANLSSHCGFSAPNRVYRRNIYGLFNRL